MISDEVILNALLSCGSVRKSAEKARCSLTDAQRARYCQYKGLDRAAFEEVTEMVNGDLHDRLTANRPWPSRADLDAIILEVSTMVNQA